MFWYNILGRVRYHDDRTLPQVSARDPAGKPQAHFQIELSLQVLVSENFMPCDRYNLSHVFDEDDLCVIQHAPGYPWSEPHNPRSSLIYVP